MELHEIHLPSVADYVAAFQATEARITPKQRELLPAAPPCSSARDISNSLGRGRGF